MLDRKECALVVVDIQDVLMPKSEEVVAQYLSRLIKLIHAARTLDMPILVTEQNPERLGGTTARVVEALGDVPRLPKMEFGCLANEAFRQALEATEREQLLVVGMETHVCVLQTALQAVLDSYDVYIARDAVVSSRKSEYKAALERMRQEDVYVVTTDMAIFELLGAAGTPEFKKMLPLIKD
jgi:nicotinamidase-related amidase